MKKTNQLKLSNVRGANFVEYLVIVGVVALVGLTAFIAFGGNVTAKVTEEGSRVTSIKTQ